MIDRSQQPQIDQRSRQPAAAASEWLRDGAFLLGRIAWVAVVALTL